MVGAFVDGAANFVASLGITRTVATALMGVLVASFAGTTLDTACRLQRYVIQELASTFSPRVSRTALASEAYDFDDNLEHVDRATGEARDARRHALNPLVWLTNQHGATILAVITAALVAALPPAAADIDLMDSIRGTVDESAAASALSKGIVTEATVAAMQSGGVEGAKAWMASYAGKGGLILWPMFGATNQLLGGLAFLVVAFWLWRRKLPVWFLVPPMLFMLVMPAWAMIWQLFIGNAGDQPGWLRQEDPNWILVTVAVVTLLLEVWMITEALLLWPHARGRLEAALPPLGGRPAMAEGGRSC
jgi:carbon starvation protein